MDLLNEFASMIDKLISLNQERRNILPKSIKRSLSPVAYAREFCTVRVDIGRQTGKTTFVAERSNTTTLIILPYQNMIASHPARERAAGICTMRNLRESLRNFLPITELGKIKTVFVEEPSLVFRSSDYCDMYQWLTEDQVERTFILMGT